MTRNQRSTGIKAQPQNQRRTSGGHTGPQTSEIDFHRGQVLYTLANTYPSLLLTLNEAVQNAIDAGATAVMLGIDLGNRVVVIIDNGNGVSRTKFEEALASVGHGIKSKDRLGRFGRGLIAPLNKCTSFTFTSQSVERRQPIRWTFRGEDIRAQHHHVNVPHVALSAMPRTPKLFDGFATGVFATEYRTIVSLNGVTKDKVISLVDLEELEHLIRSKLGPRMRENGVKVRVVLKDEHGQFKHCDIDPVAYMGERLPPYEIVDPEAGEITIELYRAQRTGGKRRGEVVVMEAEGSYPVTMAEVVRQARGRRWIEGMEDAFAALSSGYFEGIIRAKNIELAPERTKFMFNDALMALYLAIFNWYEKLGQTYFESEKEISLEKRYQNLGLKSMDKIRETRNHPDFVLAWDAFLRAIEAGRLGKGAVVPAKGKPDGIEEESSIRTGQGGAGVPRQPREGTSGGGGGSGKGGGSQTDPVDRPGDVPFGTVGSPRGGNRRPRQIVKGDSQGMWFEFSPLTNSVRLWEFDFTLGILTFNTRHKLWEAVAETNGRVFPKNDKMVMHLQEWLALQVLHLVLHHPDPEDFEQAREFVDKQIKHYIDMFILIPSR